MPYPIPEKLNYAKLSLHMYECPLENYSVVLSMKAVDGIPQCWRGYVGIWKINEDKKLYLTNLIGTFNSQRYRDISKVIHLQHSNLFAEWFTGEVRCPIGKVLKYRPYQSLYESELVLGFESGILTSEKLLQPRAA